MNKLMIIGNLTRDPEVRSVQGGYTVCDFTVAVNNTRRNQNQADGQNDATFFRVTTWNVLCPRLYHIHGKTLKNTFQFLLRIGPAIGQTDIYANFFHFYPF